MCRVCWFDCVTLCLFVCFFFFQAEDGIRDYKVTGVQTCALPILSALALRALPVGNWSFVRPLLATRLGFWAGAAISLPLRNAKRSMRRICSARFQSCATQAGSTRRTNQTRRGLKGLLRLQSYG